MKKTKEEKGISLISLVIAVTLILVIAGILLYNSRNYTQIAKLENLHNDIQLLQEQIEVFYSKNGSLPILDVEYMVNLPESQRNPNDGDKYYVINLDVLDNIRLNYGKEFETLKNDKEHEEKYKDLYIVNEKSHTVYYVKGITVEDTTYYRDNTQYSTINIEEETEQNKLYVGDYVDYTPQNMTTSYVVEKKYSGHENMVYEQENLTWRILSIDENKKTVDIIGTPTEGLVYLDGSIGYNNGVYLINDLCSTFYSNQKLGATARNLKIEDIQDKMKAASNGKKIYENYTTSYTNPNSDVNVTYGSQYTISQFRYYPKYWKGHEGFNDISSNGTLTAYTSEEEGQGLEASELTVTQTFWHYNAQEMKNNFIGVKTRNGQDNSIYYELLCNGGEGNYFLASRLTMVEDSTKAGFCMGRVRAGAVWGDGLFYSNAAPDYAYNSLRPVVTLPMSYIDMDKGYESNGDIWSVKE